MLFDIEKDPEEREDIADQHPHIVKVALLILHLFQLVDGGCSKTLQNTIFLTDLDINWEKWCSGSYSSDRKGSCKNACESPLLDGQP